jgi:ubiquitin-conjugating enzyme E2 S
MGELAPAVAKRIVRELRDLEKTPCEGIRVFLNEHNLTNVQAELEGPTGTPFEGGLFKLRLTLGTDFPNSPPKGFFTTKIFHPNVSSSGGSKEQLKCQGLGSARWAGWLLPL